MRSTTTPNEDLVAHGPDHLLVDHLRSVAGQAAAMLPQASAAWGHLAGLWHDLGKFRPGFQRYVRKDPDAHVEERHLASRDKTHSAAGALHALHAFRSRHGEVGRRAGRLLAHLIAAHHTGLYDAADLDDRLGGAQRTDSEREYREALDAAVRHAPNLLALPEGLDPKSALLGAPGLTDKPAEPLAQALWLVTNLG